MKNSKIYKIVFVILIPLLSFIGTYIPKYIDLIKNNKAKDNTITEQKEKIVKRNLIINIKQDKIYGLIEEKTECITTQKVLSETNKTLRANNFDLILKDAQKEDSIYIRNLPVNSDLKPLSALSCDLQRSLHKTIQPLKTIVNELPILEKKRGFLRRLFKKKPII